MLVGEGCAHIASSMSCVAESSPVMLRHSAMNLLAIRPGLSPLILFLYVREIFALRKHILSVIKISRLVLQTVLQLDFK
jgi:hypothetical protein